MDWIKILSEIDGLPPFKNSNIYESSDWRDWRDLTTFPVQRELTRRECVFDLDDVTSLHMTLIPNYLKETGLKFIAWQSGPNGMHIHFWTQIVGKQSKKALVKYMASKLEEMFGIKNDLGPMGQGIIRCEESKHPNKGYQKTHLMTNLSPLFPINEIPPSVLEKVSDLEPTEGQMKPRNTVRDGKIPTCMKYILSHQFSDGRKRLLFIVVSWWKGNGNSEQEIFKLCREWAIKQNWSISNRTIWSTIKSTNGKVGCTYRHTLLEELGVDMEKCKYE